MDRSVPILTGRGLNDAGQDHMMYPMAVNCITLKMSVSTESGHHGVKLVNEGKDLLVVPYKADCIRDFTVERAVGWNTR